MSELRLGFPFTSGMVMQRDRDTLVWGWDRPGQSVTLSVESATHERRSARAEADERGVFHLTCPALPAGGPYRLVVEGSGAVAVEDVLAGEVWLGVNPSGVCMERIGRRRTSREDVGDSCMIGQT